MNQLTGNDATVLEVDRISKRFPGVQALSDVSLQLHANEVLAVIGENGAGKSTLMKILAGIESPDQGEIRVAGRTARIDSVHEATRLGIALIHQELNLCDNLDVASNIFLGREPRRWGFIHHASVLAGGRSALASIGLETPPEKRVSDLSIGQKQMVEIAKAVSTSARIIIMDEPTSSLSHRETQKLFELIGQLRRRGVSIIYISHRLSEVQQIADRVVVLRDGRNAGELNRHEINHSAMVQLMVGRELSSFHPHQPQAPGEVVLRVKSIRTTAYPQHRTSLELRRREVVGLAGLVGAGRSELLTSIFGVTPPLEGEVFVEGRKMDLEHCRQSIDAGIALVPEDRKAQGVIVQMCIRENVSLGRLSKLTRWGSFIHHERERSIADSQSRELQIKSSSIEQVVQLLSGGNQQKVVIGKWLTCQPRVLLMDEPTRGVDVGAKQEIYRLMHDLAVGGATILFASSDLEEILSMSDRILVMHQGCLMGELQRPEFSEQAVMKLATGLA